jgi:hypothetical protein
MCSFSSIPILKLGNNEGRQALINITIKTNVTANVLKNELRGQSELPSEYTAYPESDEPTAYRTEFNEMSWLSGVEMMLLYEPVLNR